MGGAVAKKYLAGLGIDRFYTCTCVDKQPYIILILLRYSFKLTQRRQDMAKGVGGGTLTKTNAAAKPVKKLSKTTTAAKPVKKLSKATATAKPAKRLSKSEKAKIEHMERIAELIEKQKKGIKISKAAEWSIAHPNGIGKILDMRAVMR